ncbi:MAG TPA: helix-turn-helix domain-containing protein [Bacteroidia bacterium]|nr:helix-turn-helix domain-containing protein [Bacteroidia bacterium]
MESNNTYKSESKDCKMRSATGYCPRPLEIASAFLSKKWSISLIITIGNFGKLRFNDIERRLEGITAKTLTDRLKELEKEQIIIRKVYSEIPPRVEYSLTKRGTHLMKSLIPLIKWAENE